MDIRTYIHNIGNFTLLFLVFFAAFIAPIFPKDWSPTLYNLAYVGIFWAALATLGRKHVLTWIAIITASTLELLSSLIKSSFLDNISNAAGLLFFLTLVVVLINQIARTPTVTPKVILHAINGYLLLGLCFALLTAIVMYYWPNAYQLPASMDAKERIAGCVYYTFVTYTTLGYGDITPILPITRSLAVFSAVVGQLYLTVIVAMLVGKFVSAHHSLTNPQTSDH